MEFIESLLSNSYAALFIIITLGYLVGKIKIFGISLDVSAVIFVALVFGHFGVKLDPVFQQIGLVLFIFTIGMQAGPGFFEALKKHGIRLVILALILIVSAVLITVLFQAIFGIKMPIMAGLLAGAMTSTPGLASATDQFGSSASIGYGIAYPMGIICVILFLRLLPKICHTDIPAEEKAYEQESRSEYPDISVHNLLVTNPNVDNKSIATLHVRTITGAVISKVMHQGVVIAPVKDTILHKNDVVRVVGTEESLQRATIYIGEITEQEIPQSPNIDVQTLLVTNRKVVNKSIAELNLQTLAGATVTRISRSGIFISPSPSARLRFGDKLVISAPKENFPVLAQALGNDNKRLSDINILPIALGITLGIILGKLTFLGLTGGVLIVALILGRIGKTGPILWHMSSGANLLLRELGLVFFLAVVGSDAGATLVQSIEHYGFLLFLLGMLITIIPMIIFTICGRLFFKMNQLTLMGALAGSMTSTPGLSAITPITHSNAPQISYATVYPIAMVLLVLLIKLLAIL